MDSQGVCDLVAHELLNPDPDTAPNPSITNSAARDHSSDLTRVPLLALILGVRGQVT